MPKNMTARMEHEHFRTDLLPMPIDAMPTSQHGGRAAAEEGPEEAGEGAWPLHL